MTTCPDCDWTVPHQHAKPITFASEYMRGVEDGMRNHTHDDRCLDRPSLRPGRRIPTPGRGIQWNYFRTVERAWGPMIDRGYRWRIYLSFGRLTVWVGPW